MSSDSNTHSAAPCILIANDQEWTARSLESILTAEGYEIIRAYTGGQAWDRALEAAPDLIILDSQLPDISGPEVCRRLRSHPVVGWSVPIIITTAGSNGRAKVAEAMEAGAWDFATQPFDGPLLLARIRTFLQAKAALDASRADATLDSATGLYNRRGFGRRVAEMWADARRRGERITCLTVSVGPPEVLHAIQRVNETAVSMAQALHASVRASDAVARLSLLDFAILSPGLDPESAGRVLERVQRFLRVARGDLATPIRTSIAMLSTDEPFDPDQLLPQAMPADRIGRTVETVVD